MKPMEKTCSHSHNPSYRTSRNGTTTSSGDGASTTADEMTGNDGTTVIELDDSHHDRLGHHNKHKQHGNGFLLNGGLPNGVHPSLHLGQASNGALLSHHGPSAIEKIAIEIAEAQAGAAGGHHAPSPLPMFQHEPFKTFLAVVYCMLVSFLSAFTMTYTHDRTPELTRSPPLPDIVFDLVPRLEWAFLACEIGMLVLVAANFVNMAFHKHRLIVLRRLLIIVGLAYSMRCVTMIVTSLSVTGYHVHCGKKVFDSVWSKLGRAVAPSIGLGMTVTGQREEMCGDYMYSGHTVSIITACMSFTEYTPSRCRLLHFLAWVTAGASLFFIVAAHEHYTVDVIIAMIVTSLIFLYYHTLANTRAHLHREVYKVRVWIPFFYYLEAKVDGVVPNEYEWPFRCPSLPWTQGPKLWHRSKSGLVD